MKRLILKWQASKYASSLSVTIMLTVFSITGMGRQQTRLFWAFPFLLVLHIYWLIYILRFPEMEITDGILKYHKSYFFWGSRVSIEVADIETITESTKKTWGFPSHVQFSVWQIITRNGTKYDYHPTIRSKKRYEEINAFLSTGTGKLVAKNET